MHTNISLFKARPVIDNTHTPSSCAVHSMGLYMQSVHDNYVIMCRRPEKSSLLQVDKKMSKDGTALKDLLYNRSLISVKIKLLLSFKKKTVMMLRYQEQGRKMQMAFCKNDFVKISLKTIMKPASIR